MNQLTRLIEGFVALCLGSAKRVIWSNQTDAAGYSDGTNLYLSRPTGVEGEQQLLLALAMREVAKIQHTESNAFSGLSGELSQTAASIEDARIKQELAIEYKGARTLFDEATAIAHRILKDEVGKSGNAQSAVQLAIWAAANDAFLQTEASAAAADDFARAAAEVVDPLLLGKAIGSTQAAPLLPSTDGSVKCARRILAMLVPPPPPPPPPQAEPEPQPEPQPEPEPEEEPDQQQQPQTQPDPESEQTPSGQEQPEPRGEGDSSSDQPDSGEPSGDGDSGQDQAVDGDAASDSPAEGDPEQGDTGEPQGQPDSQSSDAPSDSDSDSVSDAASDGNLGDQGAVTEAAESDPGQTGSPEEASSSGQAADGSQPSKDPLSNALAMLRGHSGARQHIPPQSGNMAEASQGAEADAELVEQARTILADESPSDLVAQFLNTASPEVSEPEVADDAATAVDAEIVEPDEPADAVTPFLIHVPENTADDARDGDNALDPMPARLVSVLLREFQSTRPRKSLRCENGRDVDSNALWRLKRLGDTRVFRKKNPAPGVDAAVWLLIDRSESMEEGIRPAMSATHAFATALQRISGVQTAISMFPSSSGDTETLLKFRQNTAQVTAALKSIQAAGSTPMAEAINDVLPQLLKAGVDKRVLIIVTDGEPDNRPTTVNAIRNAVNQGVEVLGIGIGGKSSIGVLLPKASVTINEVADLPEALSRLFKEKLNDCFSAF